MGSTVHVFVVPTCVTVAATGAAVPARTVSVVLDTPFTGSLKVTVGLTPTATELAPATGARAVTVGAMVSAVVKVQVVVASALPLAS